MSERGPIVCATDLGRAGARAVELAARIASTTSRPLRLVHVTGSGPELVDSRGESEVSEAQRVLRERLRTRIEAAAAALEKERVRAEGLGPHAEAELLEGRPWEQIVEYATREQASLLVVGPHGTAGPVSSTREGLTEWILGTTADRVVRHAHCPVVVGPRQDAEIHPLRRSNWLVAIDFSEASRAALDVARDLAEACEATLIPLHVEPSHHDGTDDRSDEPLRFAESPSLEEMHERERELHDLVREVGLDVDVKLAFGDPAECVAMAADELDVALVVMGTRGRTGLAHLLLGSTAERTLRRSNAPVLCVHAPS